MHGNGPCSGRLSTGNAPRYRIRHEITNSDQGSPLNERQAGTRAPRSPHSVHVLARDWGSLSQVLTPVFAKIDPLNAATQLLIVTPDVESTVALVAGAFAEFGVQGVDVLPATAAARTARLLRTDPARAIAGPPGVLRELIASSSLQLGELRAIVFAWIENLVEPGTETATDLETVLAEAPKDAERALVARKITPALERFIERHLHQARRIGTPPAATGSSTSLSYVTTTRAARPSALRRALDELDPPSAAVLVRGTESEAEARVTLRQLGYRRADDVVRVTRAEIPPNTHTVILYDAVLEAANLEKVAIANPTRVVALIDPADVEAIRALVGGRATPLERPAGHPRARRSDELLRRELRELLHAGYGAREIATIEPLLAEFDAAEIAGALVRLLEREREKLQLATPVPFTEARPRGPSVRPSGARDPKERRGPPRGGLAQRGPARGGAREDHGKPPRRPPSGGDRRP